MKNTKLLGGILAVVIVFFGALVFLDSQSEEIGSTESLAREQAPTIDLMTLTGESVRSRDFAGKVVVANAWASWCPFCVHELPDFVTLQEEFGDAIVVVAINRQESRERQEAFLEEQTLSQSDLIYLEDQDDSFYRSIGGFAMPETLFIAADGTISTIKRGVMPLEEMRRLTEEALALTS